MTFEKLISWSEHSDPGVKHFSGAATYAKAIRVPASLIGKDRRLYLDLGNVAVMAEVTLNGRNLGIFWKHLYHVGRHRCRQGQAKRDSSERVNLWINRMIGDELLPEDSHGAIQTARSRHGRSGFRRVNSSPTGRHTFTSWRLWKKDDPLQPSGLLGPVTLRGGGVAPLAWKRGKFCHKRRCSIGWHALRNEGRDGLVKHALRFRTCHSPER